MMNTVKSIVKTSAAVIMLSSVLLMFGAATHVANADLTGSWKYSDSKSKAPESNFRIAPLSLGITAETNGIAVERTTAGFNGGDNIVSTDHLSFDGKETESVFFANSKKKSIASWSEDGKKLTVNSTILFNQNGDTREFKSTEVYSLSNDGKSISIAYSSASFEGMNGTFVYDKTN